MQASPHDPENFPFVVLGNKIDMEESKRMVRSITLLTSAIGLICYYSYDRCPKNEQ